LPVKRGSVWLHNKFLIVERVIDPAARAHPLSMQYANGHVVRLQCARGDTMRSQIGELLLAPRLLSIYSEWSRPTATVGQLYYRTYSHPFAYSHCLHACLTPFPLRLYEPQVDYTHFFPIHHATPSRYQ